MLHKKGSAYTMDVNEKHNNNKNKTKTAHPIITKTFCLKREIEYWKMQTCFLWYAAFIKKEQMQLQLL